MAHIAGDDLEAALLDAGALPAGGGDAHAPPELPVAWVTCQHPDDADIEAALGDPPDPQECWLCRRGRASDAAIDKTPFADMFALYFEQRGGGATDAALAHEMAAFFEERVRRPANRARADGEGAIPPLSAGDIYWHVRLHVRDPTGFVLRTIEELEKVRDLVRRNALYKRREGDGAARSTVVPDKQGVLLYIKATEALERTYRLHPEELVFHDDGHPVPRAAWFSGARRVVDDERKRRRDADLFGASAVGEPPRRRRAEAAARVSL